MDNAPRRTPGYFSARDRVAGVIKEAKSLDEAVTGKPFADYESRLG